LPGGLLQPGRLLGSASSRRTRRRPSGSARCLARWGGTCLRIGCIPTKAWAQTALALKQADETFGQLGVKLGGSHLDFPAANKWKTAVVKRMTSGVAYLFKANGVTWIQGTGTFTDAHTLAVTGGEDVTFTSAIIATGSFPLRPPIEGLESDRCVDSEGLLAQTEVPRRLVILGGGVIGCEFASILARFGSQVTIIEMLPALISGEDTDASDELAKQFRRRGITLHLGRQCTKVEDSGSELTVHFGDGETVMADLMLVSVGRGPLVDEAPPQLDSAAQAARGEHGLRRPARVQDPSRRTDRAEGTLRGGVQGLRRTR
jgi:dihydrolipoamide dehydrogenase